MIIGRKVPQVSVVLTETCRDHLPGMVVRSPKLLPPRPDRVMVGMGKVMFDGHVMGIRLRCPKRHGFLPDADPPGRL